MADRDRSNWVTEMDTVTDAPELELLAGLVAPEVEELLQAAAARHKASDTDVTTAPFLAI